MVNPVAASAAQSAPGIPQARDAGLQAERTALSWSRTALAMLANGLLALRSGWASQQTTISVLALALLAAAGATFGYALWRRRELLLHPRPTAPSPAAIAAASAVTLAASMLGLAAISITGSGSPVSL